MILDWVPSTACFTLRVKRGEADPRAIMKETGLDYSEPASRQGEAVLFTRDAYAAAVFAEHAAPVAKAKLGSILHEVSESWRPTSNAHIRCPDEQELLSFQKADVEYALRRKNTLVGDQPGLGKTPVAICFCNEIRAKRVLVICPANIRLQWARKIREWSTMRWPYVVHPILNGSRGVNPLAEWNVVSYDLARTPAIGAALARGLYDVVILDEAHYLKTYDSQRTRAIFGDHTGHFRGKVRDEISDVIIGHDVLFSAIAGRAGAVLALTGTPLPNRPREAYTLARNLCWDSIDWVSEESFRERYNPSARLEGTRSDGSKYIYNREEAGRHGELQNRLRANFMVRHLKRDPEIARQMKLSNFPLYDLVLVDQTKAISAALEAESMLDIDHDDPEFFKHANDAVLGDLSRVRHMMGVAKAPLIADYAEMLLDGGCEKLFVVAWHIEVLNIIQNKLAKYGVVRIDGSVAGGKKQKMIDEYVRNPRLRICLGNIQSVGTGTDGLQAVCDRIVIGEPSWVNGENQQVVDRLDRMGQVNVVRADFLVAPGSLDERVLSSSLRKGKQTHLALDNRILLP